MTGSDRRWLSLTIKIERVPHAVAAVRLALCEAEITPNGRFSSGLGGVKHDIGVCEWGN